MLNATFHAVDRKLSELAAAGGTHSGCTAVTAFLRLEDEEGNPVGEAGGVGSGVAVTSAAPDAAAPSSAEEPSTTTVTDGDDSGGKASRIGHKIKELLNGRGSESASDSREAEPEQAGTPVVKVSGPADVKKAAKRTLYTANAGDARAVLS